VQKRTDAMPAHALALTDAEQRHLQAVQRHLAALVQQRDFMPFEQWMHHALYAPDAPHLGYYTGSQHQLGDTPNVSDFTTAPEFTPLFGQVLAEQVAQILTVSQSVNILEFGAGTGALAAALIPALQMQGITPHYSILEVSAALRQRQQARLGKLNAHLHWLTHLPSAFEGCVLANEVLDAMPVTLFRCLSDGQVSEVGVGVNEAQSVQPAPDLPPTPFYFVERPADEHLAQAVAQRMPALPGYQSEINFQAEAWVRHMGHWLRRGAALIMDYGFPRHEYYHPQRMQGTLMCHFRHHAHAHPLVLAGMQDITAHIDFTAMAQAASQGGLDILGYTSQANFLMNAGLLDQLKHIDTTDVAHYGRAAAAVQRLVSEAEMGELFKVMALGRGIDTPLLGFAHADRRARLGLDTS